MPKKLREIITERYPDDYEQKTEVAKSFVAMHRDSKIINKLGAKGGTEDQFKGGTEEAPYNKQSNKAGFPGEDEFNDYNLPTHYDSADAPVGDEDDEYEFEDDDNDIDNYKTRSRISNDGTSEETEPRTFLQHLEEQSLTRKHFREVANTVRAIEDPKKRWEYASHHAAIFAKANPRFDPQKFYDAAGTRNPLDISTSKGKKSVKEETIDEKWSTDYETPKSKRGMWDGYSLEDLHKARKTATGTRLKEINFAIRAKTGWGKV